MDSKAEPETLLDVLSLISEGRVTITVGGFPFVSIRSDEKELDIEVSGAKKAGVSLSRVITVEEGTSNVLVASEHLAKKLSSMSWRLNLYDRGSRILTIGRGASRLTGRVSINPLKLRSLLDALR